MQNMPQDPSQHWEWIKYQLRLRKCSTATVARKLGITIRCIRKAKECAYPKVERAIASELGTTPDKLWPQRWLDESHPKRKRPNRAESLKAYHDTEEVKDSCNGPLWHRKESAGA
ncbi:helix-turn-helix domain-containing protein [Pseudomonas nitroreducens]|uniref:helix-turn-helix domain-containing protein n=1 Tax=Pseudomonas nitroreducens TaxID=46680 RepID=UPI002D80A3F9|nr:helix-turn-helix domain-containing protein [Pseudomonas nitroreducens]